MHYNIGMASQTHLFQNKIQNTIKTAVLMGGLFIVLGIIGYALSIQFGNINFLYISLGIGILMNFFSYWFSDSLAIRASGALPVDLTTAEGKRIHNSLQTLSAKAGLPMPRAYIIHDQSPNAFATGRNESHSAVAVTSGLLAITNDAELDGVIAHELAHIGNKDILISSVVAMMVGVLTHMLHIGAMGGGNRDSEGGGQGANPLIGFAIVILGPIIGMMVQMAVSRSREFQADATGALITGNPEGLASALINIHKNAHMPLQTAKASMEHMYISNPFGGLKMGSGIAKLFMSHPPVEERVARLRGK